MNSIKQNPIKFVKLFSVLYLFWNVVSRIIYYTATSIVYAYPISFAAIFSIILSIIPITLFIIYIFKFFGTSKTQILLPISYGVSILLGFYGLIQNIKSIRYISYYSSTEALRYAAVNSLLNILFSVIGLAFAIFLLITCISNFKYLKAAKKIVLIKAAISVFSLLLGIVSDIITGYSFHIIHITSYLISMSSILSHIAYIVFWLYAVDKRNTSPLESDLILLKQKYDNGEITEEEFNLGKAKILDNL